jgi:hypothetical protein
MNSSRGRQTRFKAGGYQPRHNLLRDELGFLHRSSRTSAMPDNSECKIAAADALTLLLHNQHALGAAIEEITKLFSENGLESVAANAAAAMETLDINAEAITAAIMRLRQS